MPHPPAPTHLAPARRSPPQPTAAAGPPPREARPTEAAPRGTPPARRTLPALTPHLFVPSRERPVRAKTRQLAAATQVLPHQHPWAQVAFSTTGVIRLTADRGTYIVPPTRALWIPPGVEHAVTTVEDAEVLTLYVHQPRGRCGPGAACAHDTAWRQCRVLEVSELLRALVREMPTTPDDGPPLPAAERTRERHLSALICDELARAPAVRLGVDLPHDKRLRHLCEAVLADPARHETLADWAQDTGASPRTVARLFRQELGCTFTQWRQQVLLARAVALAAGGRPMGHIANELGYSASAFSAMVRRAVGQPPGRFLAPHAHSAAGPARA